jgi:hypothetical protein
MLDRGLVFLGLAGTVLSLALPYMRPKIPRRWAYAGGGASSILLLIGLGMILLPAGAQTTPSVTGDCNVFGNYNSPICTKIINPPPARSPRKLYLQNNAEIGDVIGIHPSNDQTIVTFDQLMVPDDFPWGEMVLIQHARIECSKPQGTVGRIDGVGAPVNKFLVGYMQGAWAGLTGSFFPAL